MKKIILSTVAILAFGFANAQDLKSKKGENYLPEAGDWAISFQANPFLTYFGQVAGGNASSGFTANSPITNSFVGKKFIDAKSAYRVVANLGFGSNNLTNATVPGTNDTFATYKQSSINLTAGLGKEWRKGNTRLQGFYGADALIGFSSTKWTETNNAAGNGKYETGTSINFGVTGFIGAEYFILPKMSIGAQYNYGLQIASNGASKYTPAGGTEAKGESTTDFNLGGVTSGSINLTLHF